MPRAPDSPPCQEQPQGASALLCFVRAVGLGWWWTWVAGAVGRGRGASREHQRRGTRLTWGFYWGTAVKETAIHPAQVILNL